MKLLTQRVTIFSMALMLALGTFVPTPVQALEEKAPVIDDQSNSRTLPEGRFFGLSVSFDFDTHPWPTCQWQSKMGNGNWEDIIGEKDKNMGIRTSMAINGIKYRCIVSNSLGSATSDEITITVTPGTEPPSITMHPNSATFVPGAVYVAFGIEASRVGVFQWQHMAEGDSKWTDVREGEIDTMHGGLTLYGVPLSAAGKYRCVVSNSAGSVTSNTATLTVDESNLAPSFTIQPQSPSVYEGGNATLTVKAAGMPELTYQWQVRISGGDWKDISGAASDTLALKEIPLSSAFNCYRCIATNAYGVATSETSIITVTPTTQFSASMQNFLKSNNYNRGMFTDVDETQWFGFDNQKVIAGVYEYGLMKGNSANTFNPSGRVTLAEAIAMASRVHCFYFTRRDDFVEGTAWYQSYLDYAISNAIIEKNAFPDVTRTATRAEMAAIFAKALPEKEFPGQNTVNSLPDLNSSAPYYTEIKMLYEAGVLSGSDAAGTFHPNDTISRAEASAIISRVALPSIRVSGRAYE